jgi:hypothetical protein
MPTPFASDPSLNSEQIHEGIRQRLRKYEDKSMLERFALFMGTTQLLELSLKALLHRKYQIALDQSSVGHLVKPRVSLESVA